MNKKGIQKLSNRAFALAERRDRTTSAVQQLAMTTFKLEKSQRGGTGKREYSDGLIPWKQIRKENSNFTVEEI